MAETIELAKKREAERRLALLALTGEQPEPSGSCLDAEELAALVEGRLAAEQVQPCLEHLAGCEHCYALWRQLDGEWQERTGKTNRNPLLRLISRPRFLAAAGSMLAAAASIAVFVNITIQTDRQTLMRLPEQPAREQVLTAPSEKSVSKAVAEKALAPSPPPASTSPGQTRQTEEHTAAPATPPTEGRKTLAPTRTERTTSEARDAAVPAQPPGRADKGREGVEAQAPTDSAEPVGENAPANADMRVDTTEQEAMSLPNKSVSAPKATPHAGLRATGAAAPLPAPVAGAGPLTLADWQNRIREGCQGHPGPEYFAALSRQGNQLLRESAVLTKEERRQIERLLAALGEQQPPAHQCRTLLDILETGAHGQGQ